MVKGWFPSGVDDVVFTVRVDDPDPVTDVGLKLVLAPVGSPLTLKVTELLKPPLPVTLTV